MKVGAGYRAWYAFIRDSFGYRIGHAVSPDGYQWQRQDQNAGIELSPAGWDSQMMEHPLSCSTTADGSCFITATALAATASGTAIADSLD